MKQLVIGPVESGIKENGVTLITNAVLRFSNNSEISHINCFKNQHRSIARLINFLFPCGVINVSLIMEAKRIISQKKLQKVLLIGPQNGINSLIIHTLTNVTVSCALIDNKELIYRRALSSKLTLTLWLKYSIGLYIAIVSYRVLGSVNKNISFIFVSDEDGQQASKYFKNVHIIKNGTDTVSFSQNSHIRCSRPSYVFHGDFDYEPNRIARSAFICFMVNTNNKGLVFGKHNDLGSDQNVKHFAYVEDISQYINDQNIYFCPLQYGGGIKNKVLEALAAGMLVVGSKYAFDGIDTSQIECIIVRERELENKIYAINLEKEILEKYKVYNPKINIEYTRKHHNWEKQVRKYLSL